MGLGDVRISLPNGSVWLLEKVRHIPDLRRNLISVGQLDDEGHAILFVGGTWKVTKGARVLARTLCRYSHGFELLPLVALIQQFFGTHTDSTIFTYWSRQFFGIRTDSPFCRYSPGFNNLSVLTRILIFFLIGPDSFSVLGRIPAFACTRPDSIIFRYSH